MSRTIGQALGFLEQTGVETGASQEHVDESGSGLSPGRLIRQKSLTLPEPAERPARIADVRKEKKGDERKAFMSECLKADKKS